MFGSLAHNAKTARTQTSYLKSFTVGGLGAQLFLKGALKV